MNNRLRFFRGAELIAEVDVDGQPVEIGSDGSCDVCLGTAEIAPQQWLVASRGGTVLLYDVAAGRASSGRTLPLGCRVPLGREHAVERVQQPRPTRAEPHTDPLVVAHAPGAMSLVIGHGSEARRVAIRDRPLRVGSDHENDVIIYDRTVSGRHCHMFPTETGVLVRDMGSRNGTYVDGVRVLRAHVHAGANLRLGRTRLRLVERAATGRASRGAISASAVMAEVFEEVRRCGALGWPTLVLGESGVGKEVVAHAVHAQSPRRGRPFVALNAGGLPSELVETELFGHERGAFTGATTAHRGVFEQAHGGTLFLDEIGELPLSMQARLLRVLETWEVRRVGAETTQRVDVRLVCATHRDLRAMVTEGTFREDLYYRLARLVVDVPPLRARPADIEALASHFLAQVAEDLGPRHLAPDALSRLLAYRWPGNVRELRNVVTSAAASSAGCIDAVDVEHALMRVGGTRRRKLVSQDELRNAVDAHQGNLTAAARYLGMPRSTLRDRLRVAERRGA